MSDSPPAPDRRLESADPPVAPSARPRRRRTRGEFWKMVGVSAATWVMLFALARIWWRIYLVVEP